MAMSRRSKIYQVDKYHEWRWQKLVAPLVDKDGTDRMLLDMGCNAGWYMRKAQKLGYKTLGVEYDQDYIDQAPEGLEIIKADVNWYQPHCAYLTLLLCVHYHQTPEQVEALFHNLTYSTAYLIVMGRNNVNGRVVSNPKVDHLLKVLGGWDVIDQRGERAFYTVLLKNRRYQELDVEELFQATRAFTLTVKGFDDFVPAFQDFVRRTLADFNWDASDSQFMDYLKRRRFPYKLGRCWLYKKMIKELQEHGPHTALKVKGNRIEDGYHRLVVLRELGVKRVVCRVR